ncbi:MAG: GNAT family N-acetyltransferase [Armatimonadetes bacterium]|nr:GNAT family N-acetyltransferase [Armatimonadota bacterium]
MIEIRTIREDEAEQFLGLLCGVFDLDVGRARKIFFTEPMFDLARKWALYEDGEMRTILTTTPLLFGFGAAFGVAGVATERSHQRRGLAQRIIERVLEHGAKTGEPRCLLFAHKEKVYARAGLETVDSVVRADVLADFPADAPATLAFDDVRRIYESWAEQDPHRLRRDERRWKYWQWTLRTCEEAPGGYVCVEPMLCREAIVSHGLKAWPLMPGTRWLGLESMTEAIGAPVEKARHELHVMTYGFDERPQIFMTDQF